MASEGKGTSSWKDYRVHFEACSKINEWSYEQKELYLAVSLRGQAQGIFSNLSTTGNDYDMISTVLEERFLPPNQTDMYWVQFKERRQ